MMIIGTMNATTLNHGALRLADWGLIRAQGADAASFLQGQLTQDVLSLPDDRARLAGFCSAKGRLMASFVVWRADRETVYLACSADLLAPTLKRLSMFVMRAKCKLSDMSTDILLYGLVGAEAMTALGANVTTAPWTVAVMADGQFIGLPDAEGLPRGLMALPAASALPAAVLALPPLAPEVWAWLEVRSAVVRIVAATLEHFVPQMVNFELVGGVNFQKGCYPGQEVVARSQYRGTLKRRAMAFDCAADLSPGQEIFHSADPGQPAGEVVLSARRPDGGSSALVEVKLAALDAGSLHLGSVAGPLMLPTALPYAIPTDRA
jgi:folate-binding protein YgfZ